jgi:hypothetical protein
MQMVKKILLFSTIIYFAIIAFMPKTELYHTVEKALEKEDIRLNEVEIEEGLFFVNINDITVYVKGIAIAHIDSVEFRTYLFYNTLSIKNIMVDESLHTQVPAQADKVQIIYSLMNPFSLSIDTNGSFGLLTGKILLDEQNIKLDFIETKDISMLKTFLKKGEKGWIYEKSF